MQNKMRLKVKVKTVLSFQVIHNRNQTGRRLRFLSFLSTLLPMIKLR